MGAGLSRASHFPLPPENLQRDNVQEGRARILPPAHLKSW